MLKKSDPQKNLTKYLRRIEAAENDRDNRYRTKWARFYKRWRNYVDQLKDEKGKVLIERSNISVPYTFVQLETILPRLVETLFAARPYVTLKGKPRNLDEYRLFKQAEEKPWDKSADSMQQLLDHQQNITFDIQDKFHIGLKIMGLYGTTVAFVGWKYEEKKLIKKQLAGQHLLNEDTGQMQPVLDEQQQPIMGYQPFEEKETTYDDPELKFLDLGLFYVDPDAEDIDDAQYCGHVCFENKAFIQSMHDQGIWKVDWKNIPKESKRNAAKDYRLSQIGIPSTHSDEIHNDEMNLYEIHYYWEDDKCVVLINRAFVALDSDNPFWHKKKPYVKDVYTKAPGEFYGISLIEMIEDLQDELNTERNQRIDFRSASLRRTFTQLRDAEITPKNWEVKMNGRIIVESHEDIKELPMNPLPGDSFTQEGIVKQDMQDATGAQDVVVGTSGASETATTTMSKDNNASMRFKLIISSVEKRLLVGISRLMVQLNQQFISEERLLDVDGEQGDQFIELSPEEIQGEFRFTAAGSSVEPMANKEAFKQRMVELYSIASKDPFFQQFPVKRRNLLKKVFEAFDIKDTDTLLPTDEEMQQFMQQQAMQAQQQQEQTMMEQQQNLSAEQQRMQQDGHFKQQDLDLKREGMANQAMQAERGLQTTR
mgnify:CR=1 FL=1